MGHREQGRPRRDGQGQQLREEASGEGAAAAHPDGGGGALEGLEGGARGFSVVVNFFTSFGYFETDAQNLQVAREIRKLNSGIPIIILSAYGELLDESLGVADLWIRKGEEDPQYLLARLKELLKAKPRLRQ